MKSDRLLQDQSRHFISGPDSPRPKCRAGSDTNFSIEFSYFCKFSLILGPKIFDMSASPKARPDFHIRFVWHFAEKSWSRIKFKQCLIWDNWNSLPEENYFMLCNKSRRQMVQYMPSIYGVDIKEFISHSIGVMRVKIKGSVSLKPVIILTEHR